MASSAQKTTITLKPNTHIHFVGIGGVGMSGIAEILARMGFKVSGSDVSRNALIQNLQALGVNIAQGHAGSNLNCANLVVTSTAISDDNPEILAAKQAGVPIVKRAQMLGHLMQQAVSINIAGTHGKTTTSSMVASVLNHCGLNPSFVVGGWLHQFGSNAQLGEGRYFVAEADESDASFLYLPSNITVVTNIGADHLETYQGDFDKLKQTFVNFLARLPEDGTAIVCVDDPVVQQLLPKIKRHVVTYGFSDDADIRATDFEQHALTSTFRLHLSNHADAVTVTVPMPGKHNAQNALAAIVVGLQLGVAAERLIKGVAEFAGVGRRFQVIGEVPIAQGSVTLVDDYGHHPDEVAATIAAARRAFPDKRLVMVFQPHRYTRTQALFEEFINVLSQVDQLILLDIYAASEAPIEGVSGKHLYKALKAVGCIVHFCPEINNLAKTLAQTLVNQDLLLTQGAGSIGKFVRKLDQNRQMLVNINEH